MTQNRLLAPSGIFIISLIVYFLTLSPTVSFTDNGELAGVAHSLGIAHPSGYPLLAILSHLWTLIPTGWTTIYQLNIFAAVLTASSSVILFFTIRLLLNHLSLVEEKHPDTKKKSRKLKSERLLVIQDSPFKGTFVIDFISICIALGFSFSSLVWEQAVVFEVYSLQFLIINLSLYFLLRGILSNEDRFKYYLIAGLFVGFGFANHLTTILIIPAILYLYFKNPGKNYNFEKSNLKQMLKIFLMILAGASIYIYMPLRSMSEPDFNWGYVHRGIDKFLYHVQGKQYQVWMFAGMDIAFDNLGKFLGKLPYNLAFIGLIPFVAGIIRFYKSYKEYLWYYTILTLTCVMYSINYSIHDIDVYFYLAIYSFLIITAVGFLYIAENFEKLKYISIILPILNIGINYSDNDKTENYLVYDYARNVVDNLGENAIIITAEWDYWNSAFWYLQKVENYRPDIVLIEREILRRTWFPLQLEKWYPDIIPPCKNNLNNYVNDLEKFESGMSPDNYPNIQQNYVELLRCFIESNIETRPIYVTFDYMNSGMDAEPLKGYNIVPAGFAFKIEKGQGPFKQSIENLKLDRFINYPKDTKHHLEQGILESASINLTNIGRYSAITGDKLTAEKAYLKALEIFPNNPTAEKGLREIKYN